MQNFCSKYHETRSLHSNKHTHTQSHNRTTPHTPESTNAVISFYFIWLCVLFCFWHEGSFVSFSLAVNMLASNCKDKLSLSCFPFLSAPVAWTPSARAHAIHNCTQSPFVLNIFYALIHIETVWENKEPFNIPQRDAVRVNVLHLLPCTLPITCVHISNNSLSCTTKHKYTLRFSRILYVHNSQCRRHSNSNAYACNI